MLLSLVCGALCLLLGIQRVVLTLELVVRWPVVCPQVGRRCIPPSYDLFPLRVSTQLFPRPGSGLTRHWPLCHHCPTEGRSGHSEEDAASKRSNDFREREEGTVLLMPLRPEWCRGKHVVPQGMVLTLVQLTFIWYWPWVLWETQWQGWDILGEAYYLPGWLMVWYYRGESTPVRCILESWFFSAFGGSFRFSGRTRVTQPYRGDV